MASSKLRKFSFGAVFGLFAIAISLQLGLHQQLLKWGLQIYLGEIFNGRVAIKELRGGYFHGITLKDIRFYHRSASIPLLVVDEIASDFHLLGSSPARQECTVSNPKIFLQECLSTLDQFSIPLESPLVLLPRGGLWGKANFSIVNGAVFESFNRKDNVLLSDLSGSITPSQNQLLEFYLGTSKTSSAENRLSVYGTVHSKKESSNVDIDLALSHLEKLNLFLRTFHVLKGNAHLNSKIRAGKLETVELEFHDVDLFFPSDNRVLRKLEGKVSANGQFVSLRDCKLESEGLALEIGGDAQRVTFARGRVDITHFLAKASVLAQSLSRDPLNLDLQMSATIFYRDPGTLKRLEWNKELLESLSLLEGKVGINKLMDLEFQGKYAPGLPFGVDYKILSMDFEKLKSNWFGDKLGSLFSNVRIGGEGRAQCQWDCILLDGALNWNDDKIAYRMLWTERQLKIEDFRIDEATNLLGKLDLDHRDQSELVFHFQNESITRFIRALGQDREVSLTGKFSGELAFKGNPLDPSIQGSIDLKSGMLRGMPFKEGQINLTGKFPKIYLDRSVIFIQKNMPVTLSGHIDLSQEDVFKNVKSEMHAMAQQAQ